MNYLLPGILLITIASGISYTAYRLFLDLQGGIFERFQSMPIARSAVLWAHVLTSLVANLISLVVVVLVALVMGFRSGAGVLAWLAVAGILVLFTLALTWLAVIPGLTAKSVDGASAFSYPLIFLPFISSAFVPTATMPGPVRAFAENQPVTSIVNTIRDLFAEQPVGTDIWVALAWCVGILVVAVFATRLPRRSPDRRRIELRQDQSMLTIGQLAAYAGVTVRAVRHYHQIGLLPEPERDASGYRRYGAPAVVSLIKIRTLADAGVPLAQIGRMLEADASAFAEAVERIDSHLRDEIERLEASRKQIAQLAAGDSLVLPPEVVAYLDRLREIGASERMMAGERDGWILVAARWPDKVREWMPRQAGAARGPAARAALSGPVGAHRDRRDRRPAAGGGRRHHGRAGRAGGGRRRDRPRRGRTGRYVRSTCWTISPSRPTRGPSGCAT